MKKIYYLPISMKEVVTAMKSFEGFFEVVDNCYYYVGGDEFSGHSDDYSWEEVELDEGIVWCLTPHPALSVISITIY